MEEQRQKIIDSVFSRRNASGDLEETYVSHVKIWEDPGPEGGGKKPRYILLSQANSGNGFLHKSKLNTNGTYSVGKTWRLSELRAIQVVSPLSFNITLARTYKWQTEHQADQSHFLESVIRVFRLVTKNAAPLQLDGIQDQKSAGLALNQNQLGQRDYQRIARSPSPNGDGFPHPPTPTDRNRDSRSMVSPDSVYTRNGPPSSAESPVNLSSLASRARPPSFGSGPPGNSVPSRPARRPSATASISSLPQRNPQIVVPSVASSELTNGINRASYQEPPDVLSYHDFGEPSVTRSRKVSTRGLDAPTLSEGPSTRRDQKTRISFFDPTNQTMLDALLNNVTDNELEIDGEEGDAQATLTNVEEMIEGYEWASEDVISRKTTKGAVDLIEARLLDELMALEKANIHSFLESDDRIGLVMKYMDEAITELDSMDGLISTYKIHLNAVNDDIVFIQSQNRGLQVQNQNQRALLGELQNLLKTVHVEQDALLTLTQESLEKAQSIERLEEAVTELYKALQAGRDTEMAATMERLQEYRTHNSQFCKRVFDFLSIMFTAQSKLLLGDKNGLEKSKRGRPSVVQHQEIETYLGRYAGLMLYLKEMDEGIYGRLCAAYFSAASELHSSQIKALFSTYITYVKRAPEEDSEQGFGASSAASISKGGAGMRRAGTIIRSPIEGRLNKVSEGDLRASEALGLILEQIAPLIFREDDFITDFLQINDAALTFADYMGLDSYFRRQAARSIGLSQGTMKLVRGAMDLIFSFFPAELKSWVDSALTKDSMEIFGVLATVERFQGEAEERGNQFFVSLLSKQQARLKSIFDRHVSGQVKSIEQTKITSKKRKGVAPFIKHFPNYISRVENQLVGVDGLEIRTSVDTAYEKIVQTMFDSLKQMAKLEGEGEDKGQLNYHVILVENMHYFVAETSKFDIASIATFSKRAEKMYDENLNAYIKIVLRRPFGKLMDFFEGISNLLKTTSPTEIPSNAAYNKGTLKKICKEFNAKDVRKHVDVLFKRVEKHFTEASEKTTTEDSGGIIPGTVLVGVWKACEDELLKSTTHFSNLISQCYKDSSVTLEYATGDVEAAFRRQRIGS